MRIIGWRSFIKDHLIVMIYIIVLKYGYMIACAGTKFSTINKKGGCYVKGK
jgi:hypothetical protein